MGASLNDEAWDRAIHGLEQFFAGWEEDLKETGEIAAAELVRATLAGIGADDQPFAPYSPSYQAQLDAVGGKPQGTVNLRGVFSKDQGKSNPKFRSAERRRLSGADRRAYISVTAGGKTFTAQTPVTRVARGLTDSESEMSLDLIRIVVSGHDFQLTYSPRQADYMLAHNAGDGKLPQREWFTLKRQNVQAAIALVLQKKLAARVERFNRGIS